MSACYPLLRLFASFPTTTRTKNSIIICCFSTKHDVSVLDFFSMSEYCVDRLGDISPSEHYIYMDENTTLRVDF